MRKLIFCIGLLLAAIRAQAQMERTVYQVFPVDSALFVALDIVGFSTIEIITWQGTDVLVEARVQVWNATPAIVDDFIKNGRYEVAAEKKDSTLSIATKIRDRKPFKTRRGECTEIATIKIFVPDYLTWDAAAEGGGDVVRNAVGSFEWHSAGVGKDKLIKLLSRKQDKP
jgi:hypothetical protein